MGKIITKDLAAIQKENMLNYFMALMKERAIADVRDGCKPIHRYTLWAAYDLKLTSNKPHKKSARLVGEVLGKYSPHGDSSAYDAAIRMAQDFSLNVTLMDGHGNVGSVDGSSAAAMRYTEMRLSKFAEYNLYGLNKGAVDFERNYDETEKVPKVLPARVPLLLLNGSFGIAGGFCQSIPPHNLNDVCNMTIKILENPDITVQEIAKELVPDFPTGGVICSKKAVENAYITGNGKVKLRCQTHFETDKKGKYSIIIDSIPYMTTTGPRDNAPKSGIIYSIQEAVRNKVDGLDEYITGIHDKGNKNEIEVEIILDSKTVKSDEDAEVALNLLFKNTLMETTYSIILIAKNGDYFKRYNIKDLFTEFIEFRMETIRRPIIFDINKKTERKHILEGLIKVLPAIDNLVKILKSSKDVNEVKSKLKKKYDITDFQATAIVDTKISSLVSLEIDKLVKEKETVTDEINTLKESLSEDSLRKAIIAEQKEVIKKWGSKRKTEVTEIDTEITKEDIIADEEILILVDKNNFIKRVSNNFKIQKRGNKRGTNIGENGVTDVFSANTKDHILCFTDMGRVFDIKAYEITEVSDLSKKGKKIESYLKLKDTETVTNIICLNNDQMKDPESNLVFITKYGMIKRVSLELFSNILSTGIIAIMLNKDDKLRKVLYIDTNKDMQDVVIATQQGIVVRYSYEELPLLKRDTKGNSAICLSDDDCITDMTLVESEDQLIFFATRNGLGKVVKVHDEVEKKDPNNRENTVITDDGFPRLKRSSTIKGRIGIKLKTEEDKLVSIQTIDNEDQKLMVLTRKSLLVIPAGDFRKPIKRNTTGMKLVTLKEGDVVKKVILQ